MRWDRCYREKNTSTSSSSWVFLKVWAGEILHQLKKSVVIVIPEEDNKRAERYKKSKLFHAWDEPFACRSSKLI